jgi:predicted RNA-binding Zn-ribbon protein involved in translation (DUF1610 family)
MKTSTRECPNCLKLKHTYYGCDVMVVPYYKSYIKTSHDPISLSDYHNIVITETFICPNCGEKVTNEYIADFTQEDMQTIVDREVASRK